MSSRAPSTSRLPHRSTTLVRGAFPLAVLAVAVFASAPPASAAPFGSVVGGKIEISVVDEELPVIVEAIARATGKTFLFDESLAGRATITVRRPVAPEEALAILDALLLSRGFAALQGGGGIRKILPIAEARSGAPLSGDADAGASSFLTTMVGLDVADAQEVAAKLQHLVGPNRAALGYPPTNSLILVATDAELQRLIELARALDAGDPDELYVRTFRYGSSDTVVEIAGEILQPRPGETPLELWSDERTNSVIAVGKPAQLERARSLFAQLDVADTSGSPIGVIPILYRDAAETAEMLHSIGAGTSVPGGDVLAGRSFTVVADPATNVLLVDGDAETIRVLRGIVEQLDREQPQVLVEVVALEISNPTSLALGIDWFLPAIEPNQNLDKSLTLISNPSGGGLLAEPGDDTSFFARIARKPELISIVGPLGVPIDVVVPRETAVITADEREIDTHVLLRPRLVMVPGEEHELFVGDNVPVPVGAQPAGAILAGVQTNQQIQRQDVGIVLRVEPSLGQAGKVQLALGIETSRVGPSVAGPVDLVGPTIDKREVTTKVLLGDGEVVILGTTKQNALQKSVTTTPWLGDIPFFGRFMESKRKISMDVHVVFTVQARILKTPAELLAESIRERLAYQRSFERVRELERVEGAPYALLVDTFGTAAEADALRAELDELGFATQVGRWEDELGDLYDVYATGYAGLVAATAASRALLEEGFESQIVVLPVASSFAKRGASSGYPLSR